MKHMIHVGAEKEAIQTLQHVILEILNTNVDNATKQKALDILSTLGQNGPLHITNCKFTSTP